MRLLLIVFVGLFIFQTGVAQVGNEWINLNRPYFKILVAKDGIYRLTYSDLAAAGLFSSADPKTFQLFHRGREHAILVAGENDGQFNATDYIEFFGSKNDGTLDTELYDKPSSQPHKFYNLYNDTTAYFLTYGSVQGKRITLSQPANNGTPAESFHWEEKRLILYEDYSGGVDYGNIQNTRSEEGEGWMGRQIIQNETRTYVIEGITQTVPSSGLPTIEVQITGRGPMNHSVELYAGSRLLTTLSFSAFKSHTHSQTIQWSDISSNGKLSISAKVVGVPDRVSVGYIILRYPQQWDIASGSDKLFELSPNVTGISNIQITNVGSGTKLYDITDLANILQVGTTQTSTLNATVASTVSSRKIWATNTALVPIIRRTSFRNINPASHNYIIITHPLLRKPAGGYIDPVKAYAEYRALPQGGGYDTLIVNINQLYDQFNYGEQSPLAIFHFMKFLSAVKVPDYLFLVGKGLNVYENYFRSPGNYPVFKDLIPTSGYPGSDAAFTSGSNNQINFHTVSTGRLTAVTSQDVAAYLNKVKETEALPFNDLRRKNILHLSGGIFPGEPQLFRSYLEQFASVAKSFYLGGNINAIGKQTTDIELINVSGEVNNGVSLITFFGHSSSVSSDFEIGFVTNPVLGYNNKGKYPVMLMNGCYAGSVFLNTSIFGENWINTANKGAIGVIAHSSLGFANTLRNYSGLFYQVAFGDALFINKGIGDVQREVVRRYHSTYGTSPEHASQIQQMILLGDPAVRIFGADRPDYEIRPENISINSFDGTPITAKTDSLQLNFVVNNLGKAESTDLTITIKRTLNNGSVIEYDSTFNAVLYSDTLSLIIPGNIANGSGNNIFSISIDNENLIDELRKDNNLVTLSYFIPLNGTKNLYPNNYAIVNTRDVNISFQHTDMLSAEREFLLELDTSRTFSSVYKKQFTVKGTVLAFNKIELLDQDTLPYYWRTKLANVLPEESNEWVISSFTYIKNGSEGWAQVDFPQYADNSLTGLISDAEVKKFHFKETVTDVWIKTFGAAAGKPTDSVSLKIDGTEYVNINSAANYGCRNNTINLIAFDKKTTQPYIGIPLTFVDILSTFGGRTLMCGRKPYFINSFTKDELTLFENANIALYVDNIPEGDSVILFSIGDAGFGDWPMAVKVKLSELGISISQIDNLLPGEPVAIFAQKGIAPGTAKIYRAANSPANQQQLEVDRTITGRNNSGLMHSTVIGPAKQWKKFFVQLNGVGATDQLSFDIWGISLEGKEILLKTNLTDDEELSGISTAEYPYLKITFNTEDPVFLTAVQLSKWIVTYEPVAEGLLFYHGPLDQQTVFEGQVCPVDYSFINISNTAFQDSLVVRYDLISPETFVSTEKTLKIQAPAPGNTTKFTVAFNTIGHEGLSETRVFVNPRIVSEQNYDNNFIGLNNHLNIKVDGKAPVLSVTFDGRHLTQDEFVSSSPVIISTLWDNYQYLLKKDTIGVTMFLTYPCDMEDCPAKPIYFSRSDIQWQPETDISEFSIRFVPSNLKEGTYILRVEARDAHGNRSGAEPYEISFQVKNETTVSISPPYPNPFYYKTNFEFVLSGNHLPSTFDLILTTVNGKVVQDFSLQDINNLHIGTNTITWPGVDQNGYPLPNGIYLFQMTIRVGDEMINKKGKLVLVR